MGEALSAIGKLLISIVAGAVIGISIYNSFKTFHLETFLGFPYSAEITSIAVGFFSLVLIYILLMKLKRQL
ncbi:MAG: hypothetical protein ABIG39_06780 [Candidatus Micrarchaeota archaeon]